MKLFLLSLICLNAFGRDLPSYLQYESKIVNASNCTTTLDAPQVSFHGHWRDISNASDIDGVCRMFGYKEVAGSPDYDKSGQFEVIHPIFYTENSGCLSRDEVVIDLSGNVKQLRDSTCHTRQISSITCEWK